MKKFDAGVPGKRTKLYRAWSMMRNRVYNKRGKDYPYYGGRGVEICDSWENFQQFANDVGLPPGPEWTLDRIDTHGNYEPDNVRWATRKTQVRNRPYNALNEKTAARIRELYATGRYRQVDLAATFGCTQGTISHMIRGRTWG
jgi:hypothetical protein